jgi:DNA-binding transcriptional ArsR family regulator
MKNLYLPPNGGDDLYSPLDALRHVREAGELSDGRPLPGRLKVTLLALASYWPVIRPTLETLARDTGLQRKTVVAHLSELVELDVVTTKYEGRTAYRMLNLDRLVRVAPSRRPDPLAGSNARLANRTR